jgi:hypothetical protein
MYMYEIHNREPGRLFSTYRQIANLSENGMGTSWLVFATKVVRQGSIQYRTEVRLWWVLHERVADKVDLSFQPTLSTQLLWLQVRDR